MQKKSKLLSFTPIRILKDRHHLIQMKKRVIFGRTALPSESELKSFLNTPAQFNVQSTHRITSAKTGMSDSSILSYLNTPITQVKSIGRIGA